MHTGIEKFVSSMLGFGALNNRKFMGERMYTGIEVDNRFTMFYSCCRYREIKNFKGGELGTLCFFGLRFFILLVDHRDRTFLF